MKYHINEYDYIIPIGSNCRIAQSLDYFKYRKFSLPLDWTLTSNLAVYNAFKHEFKNFISYESCSEQIVSNYPHILNNQFNINITHEKKINYTSIEKYKKRSERLVELLNTNNKLLFIRHHADGEYIKNDLIHYDYNEKEHKKGRNPIDLNPLYELHELLNQKYKFLDFDIVLFHYKEIKSKNSKIKYVKSKNDSIGWIGDKTVDHVQCINMLNELINEKL